MQISHRPIKDITFDSSPNGLDLLHEAIEQFWEECDTEPYPPPSGAWRFMFATAIGEIGGNIVRHAYSSTNDGLIRFRLRLACNRVVACFVDSGVAYKATALTDPPDLDDVFNLPESGWGMHIVVRALDHIKYRRVSKQANVWRLIKVYN